MGFLMFFSNAFSIFGFIYILVIIFDGIYDLISGKMKEARKK